MAARLLVISVTSGQGQSKKVANLSRYVEGIETALRMWL